MKGIERGSPTDRDTEERAISDGWKGLERKGVEKEKHREKWV